MEGRDREARMEVFIGVDAAKDVHWACAVDRDARALFNRAVANDPDWIAGLVADIAALEAERVTVALDLLGGSATLLCAMLADALAAAAGLTPVLRQSGKSRAI